MIAAVGQTGGLGRILLASSLELGLIDMAVCVVDNPQRPLRPMTALVRTPQEALAVSRSKYCPVPVNELIGTIRNTQGRIAFVGLGCHMQGLQLALENQKQLQDKIVLKIGLFCDRVLTYAAADYLVRCARAKSQDVVAFDYRHKAWRGWPGDTRVVMGNGRVSNVPRYRRTDAGEVFTPIHCRLCIDKLNILSDISLGDPHGLAKGKQVPTATLVRTAAGQNVLRATQEAGKIILTPIGPEMIIELQNAAKGVDKSIAFGREMLYRGYELPCFLQTGPLRVTEGQASSVGVKWAIGLSLFLSTARGARLIRRFPSWTSLLWGTPRRYYKRWRGRLRRVFKRVMNLSRCGRVAD
jgi:coenzyme F420 hydrogenase subunit beta